MPSLSDTLESLSTRTSELAYLTTLNSKPCGPFVQAYLGIPSSSSSSSRSGNGNGSGSKNVLNLIRDSNESEIRLFKFIGESTNPAAASGTQAQNQAQGQAVQGNLGGGGGGGGGNKRVEKREHGLITPLKELRRKGNGNGNGNGRDEVEVMLRTAMKLVDDYRPMPRARAHITNLLDSHHSSQERLVELERWIEEARTPTPAQPSPPSSTTKPPSPTSASGDEPGSSTDTSDKPKLTPEEAIKAEETALKALESTLIQLRKSSKSTPNQPQEGDHSSFSPPPSTRQLPSSPPISSMNHTMQTPAKSSNTRENLQTPATTKQIPHVTNSLVNNGMTPRRPITTTSGIDRFSPLKSLVTPRVPTGLSRLRNEHDTDQGQGQGQGGRRSIFGKPSGMNRITSGSSYSSGGPDLRQSVGPSATPGESRPFTTPFTKISPEKDQQTPQEPHVTLTKSTSGERSTDDEDETVRFPRPTSPPILAPPLEGTPTRKTSIGDESIVQDTPKATAGKRDEGNDGTLDGVDLKSEGVKAGIAKIWSTLGEIMRQGAKDGEEVGEDVQSSVKHLIHLSKSDLPTPPSPSSSSISSLSQPPSSSTAQAQSKPITSETILFAHFLLSMLRSIPTELGGVDMNVMKESLNSVAKDRNFDSSDKLSTKIVYAAVGKRLVKIDRKNTNSTIRFAD